jgi:N-acetylmuramoyl-L-alanine amidase
LSEHVEDPDPRGPDYKAELPVAIHDPDRRGPDYDNPKPTQEHIDARLSAMYKRLPVGAISEPIVQTPASTANYTVTRLGYGIIGVIIHTTVGSELSAVQAFQSPTRQASAQYVLACDGSHIDQCVSEADIAWHCGRYYSDAANPLANCNTIGLEHCDNGNFNGVRPDGLYVCSSDLVRDICQRYKNVSCPICHTNHPNGIPIDRSHIRKHREVSQLATSCPDALDIDRIVAMAAGAPTPSTGDDDMLYVGPVHALSAATSFKVFDNGEASYPDPAPVAAVGQPLTTGAMVSCDAYVYSSSAVQSTDLGNGQPGPDYLWWRSNGRWIPDAHLDTTTMGNAPKPAIPAGEALTLYPPAGGGGVTMAQVDSAIATAPPNQQTKDYVDSHILTALSNFKAPPAPHHHNVLGIINTGPAIPDPA